MARPRKQSGDDGDRIKAMFYSSPNGGKTHLLGTAAADERTAPMLILDFEGGLKTLRGMPGEGTDWVVARCYGWEDFNTQYDRLLDNSEGFKSVAFDSFSEIHNYAIEVIVEEAKPRRKEENYDLVEQQDYGKALIQIRRLARSFRDLPIHFFSTAHSKEFIHSKRGLLMVPNLYGKAAFEIPGLLETVGYVAQVQDEEGKEFRSLLLGNQPKLEVKCRTPWGVQAPEFIDNPTVTKLLDELGYKY